MPNDAGALAQAAALKVLADAPEARGPFVLEVRERISAEMAGRLRATWRQAFEEAGKIPPPMLLLDPGVTLRPASSRVTHDWIGSPPDGPPEARGHATILVAALSSLALGFGLGVGVVRWWFGA